MLRDLRHGKKYETGDNAWARADMNGFINLLHSATAFTVIRLRSSN